MKQILSLHLALVLLLSSLSGIAPAFAESKKAPVSTCENGECIPKLVDKLEDLTKVYEDTCLPSEGRRPADLKTYFEENGLSEQCWKYITEINHLETELLKHQNRLEARLGCESGDCKLPDQEDSLNAQIKELSKSQQQLSCTEPKKQAIKNQCGSDMTCALVAGAMGIGGYVAEMIVPENAKPKNCHLGDDSCTTQLATGFLKAAISFFEGAWDLLKMAGKAAGKQMGKFWDWVSGAEDHSSTAQLALARASEDPGVFDMLTNDFSGTMKKMWTGLVAALKEWLKADVFCEKWEKVPRFSKCLKPTDSFDCISCKSMVNGLCSVTGTLVAEVIPAFLTGGLLTAAKHGANGAAKIAKLFKVSDKSMAAIKNSRVAKIAADAGSKVDDILKLTNKAKAAKATVSASLASISKYLLTPARKVAKSAYGVLSETMKKGKVFMQDTGTGKVIVFGGKALKATGRAVLYPIDNPLTTLAFKSGSRTFEKAFKLGAPRLAVSTAATTAVVKSEKGTETILAKLEEARVKKKDTTKLEEELLKKVEPKRREILEKVLDDEKADFSDIVRNLYPELQYGNLAKKLPSEKVLAAEKELYITIEQMPDSARKSALLKRYQSHVVQGEARSKIIKDNAPTYKKIIDNSQLKQDERFKEAMKITKREVVSPEEKVKLQKALEDAHLFGEGKVFEYSWSELREKYRILTEGGFTKDEADLLIRAGLAGRPPVRELVQPGNTLFSGFAEDITKANYLDQREQLFKLIKDKNPDSSGNFIQKVLGYKKTPSKDITNNLESLYFIDYQHTVPELDTFLNGTKQLDKSQMAARYEKEAFENFKNARNYLLEEKPEFSTATLKEVHKHMMKGGIENIHPSQIGTFRTAEVYGNVPQNYAIDGAIKTELEKNPYITWIENGKTADGKFYGRAYYPNASTISKEGLDLIRAKHPQLVVEIEKVQQPYLKAKAVSEELNKLGALERQTPQGKELQAQLDALNKEYTSSQKVRQELNGKLVDAMVDDLMDWFTRERTLIGDINTPEKLDAYVDLVAKFQRDLVSIHPFANGNGRSTREFGLSYALMKEGFPPPRIIDPNADIYRSLEDWKKIVKHGILATDFLVDDMTERLKFGLTVENSTELITPFTRPPVKMDLKGASKNATKMEGVEYIDPRLYREIVKREMKADPTLSAQLESDPVGAWDKLHKKAEAVYAKNNIYYKHPKYGVERVEIGYVDDDFKQLYGKSSYDNKELFDFKMKNWYSDQITWRGLASKHAVKTEPEILQMFKELSAHNASNAVVGKLRGNSSPEAVRKAALEDFEKYNDDVFGDGLVKMAKDHSETGPMYGQSYGYSTSKNREVGKAFAMGAMVVGEYGAHRAPELQALLKSRVLVGARKAHKDVDLTRLKQVRDEFSYKYGRQQEVMGIGASDPDSISIIQTINAEGGVDLTYLRNPQKPDQIWVIKGDIDPKDTPRPEQLLKTIKLER
ncbi:hypothetical protein ACJVC5_10600 [Peredibacter sp. HCB2-198]|uniref:hypothetical protein n=1 Tax=Peredibacter sp. HCB2-198 TaxID=3383025 RepID=UPI0038B49BF8